MTREQLHAEIDQMLDKLGFQREVTQKWGSLTFQVNFENGREVLKIRERETSKPVTR